MKLTKAQKQVKKALKEHGTVTKAALALGVSHQYVSKVKKQIESLSDSREEKRFLIMSDMHVPYHHQDTFAFYKAIKEEYGITDVKNVGDIVDNHMMSYHEYETDALGPREEYLVSRDCLQELEEIFPEMTISLGNHCQLNQRKAKTAGIPLDFLRDFNDLYGLKGNWKWVDDELFDMGNGQQCYMTHSVSANTRVNAYKFSHCSVQGHHHGEFALAYYADQLTLNWSMSVGCTIDHHAPAMRYGAVNRNKKPILGCGVILGGVPHLVPMILGRGGRWIGKLPQIR